MEVDAFSGSSKQGRDPIQKMMEGVNQACSSTTPFWAQGPGLGLVLGCYGGRGQEWFHTVASRFAGRVHVKLLLRLLRYRSHESICGGARPKSRLLRYRSHMSICGRKPKCMLERSSPSVGLACSHPGLGFRV